MAGGVLEIDPGQVLRTDFDSGEISSPQEMVGGFTISRGRRWCFQRFRTPSTRNHNLAAVEPISTALFPFVSTRKLTGGERLILTQWRNGPLPGFCSAPCRGEQCACDPTALQLTGCLRVCGWLHHPAWLYLPTGFVPSPSGGLSIRPTRVCTRAQSPGTTRAVPGKAANRPTAEMHIGTYSF